MDFATLKSFENNTLVGTILRTFFEVDSNKDLLNDLEDEGILYYWAVLNDMSPSEMFDLIDCSLMNNAKFKLVNRDSSELYLGDVKLPLNWAL